MEAYFDKENLDSYIHSAANPAFADCNRMLKTHFFLKFNFEKEEMRNIPDALTWITLMTNGAGRDLSLKTAFSKEPYPPRPLSVNFFNEVDKEKLSAVYLITDPSISLLPFQSILMSPKEKEVDTLYRLIKGDDYQFTNSSLTPKRMSSWNDISPYITPCTDLIIVDRYLLSDENLHDYNLIPLLKTLTRHAKYTKINITFFVLHDDNTLESSYINAVTKIEDELQKIICSKPNVSIVVAKNKRKLEEHDRTIFSNYLLINSGDTFNYFGVGKTITDSRFIHIMSLAHKDNWKKGFEFIADMKNLLKILMTDSQTKVYGHLENHYLTK